MLTRLKAFVPAPFVSLYHRVVSWIAAMRYGFPSEKLIVIGVTGTKGKTTTSYFTAKALEAGGEQAGCTTTALFKVGRNEWLNDTHMTMLGRFQLQKLLRDMVDAGCRYAVIETSSEGVKQHRHRSINYDVAVFTNLTPEHIESHGGFEQYKQAKIELFRHTARGRRKTLNGVRIPKMAVLNCMNPHAKDFVVPGFDEMFWISIGTCTPPSQTVHGTEIVGSDLQENAWSVSFTVAGRRVDIRMPGSVNVENALAAIAVTQAFHMPLEAVMKKLGNISGLFGRFERSDEGQSYTVIVDYAHDPESFERMFDALKNVPRERIIIVLGAAGGNRDVARRPGLGKLAGMHADVVIATNEDSYDDDPAMIIRQIADAARAVARPGIDIREIVDRREAIMTAMREAKPGDLVLLLGKGHEQRMIGKGGVSVPWDDRAVAREAIKARPAS